MTRRKVRDHHEAVELLGALEASEQSLTEFCRARGLDGRSLNCWKRNLGRETAPAQRGLRLVELAVARAHPAVYRIVVDGIEVEVDDQFREDTLSRLLSVVLAAC